MIRKSRNITRGGVFLAVLTIVGPAAGQESVNVRAGDTLSSIALQHGTSWQEICQLNQLANCDSIQVGTLLKLRMAVGVTTGRDIPLAPIAPPAEPTPTSYSPFDTRWHTGQGWSIDEGRLVANNAPPGSFANRKGIEAGQIYVVKIVVDEMSSGRLSVMTEGGTKAIEDIEAPGTYEGEVTATTSGGVFIWANEEVDAVIGSLSFKPLP